MKYFLLFILLFISALSFQITAQATDAKATDLKAHDPAPLFKTQTHEGRSFDMATRKGEWTVLYFYPKAATPGCTKQACGFRDHIDKIRALGAEVFGISTDNVESLAAFHKDQNLNFALLADPQGQISQMYGTKMPLSIISKRWTFIIDPEMKIRDIQKDVDPVQDAERVAKKIKSMKSK